MSVIMGFDPAGSFGWAVYDLDKKPSAIISGALQLPKGDDVTIVDKLTDLRVQLVPLLRKHTPIYVGIEAPFSFIAGGGGSTVTISEAGQIAGAASALCMAWNISIEQIMPNSWQTIIPSDIKDRFPTWPDGPLKLNPLSKKDEQAAKKRAKACCDRLGIVATNQDARDAALIAYWTAVRSQTLKLLLHRLQMTGAAA